MFRKIQMYILSLWLLFLLVAIKEFQVIPWVYSLDFKANMLKQIAGNVIPLISLFMTCLGFVFYFQFKYITAGSTKLPKKITKIEDQNFEHLTFLMTYIVPFLRVKLEGRDLIISSLLLIIIGAIFIRTQLFYKNPTLALLGYRLYKVDTETAKNLIFISRQVLKESDNVHHIRLDDNVYFVKL